MENNGKKKEKKRNGKVIKKGEKKKKEKENIKFKRLKKKVDVNNGEEEIQKRNEQNFHFMEEYEDYEALEVLEALEKCDAIESQRNALPEIPKNDNRENPNSGLSSSSVGSSSSDSLSPPVESPAREEEEAVVVLMNIDNEEEHTPTNVSENKDSKEEEVEENTVINSSTEKKKKKKKKKKKGGDGSNNRKRKAEVLEEDENEEIDYEETYTVKGPLVREMLCPISKYTIEIKKVDDYWEIVNVIRVENVGIEHKIVGENRIPFVKLTFIKKCIAAMLGVDKKDKLNSEMNFMRKFASTNAAGSISLDQLCLYSSSSTSSKCPLFSFDNVKKDARYFRLVACIGITAVKWIPNEMIEEIFKTPDKLFSWDSFKSIAYNTTIEQRAYHLFEGSSQDKDLYQMIVKRASQLTLFNKNMKFNEYITIRDWKDEWRKDVIRLLVEYNNSYYVEPHLDTKVQIFSSTSGGKEYYSIAKVKDEEAASFFMRSMLELPTSITVSFYFFSNDDVLNINYIEALKNPVSHLPKKTLIVTPSQRRADFFREMYKSTLNVTMVKHFDKEFICRFCGYLSMHNYTRKLII